VSWFYLDGFTAAFTTGVSLELDGLNSTECLRACLDITSMACLSVAVHKLDPVSCTLFNRNLYMDGWSLFTEEGWEYWEVSYEGKDSIY